MSIYFVCTIKRQSMPNILLHSQKTKEKCGTINCLHPMQITLKYTIQCIIKMKYNKKNLHFVQLFHEQRFQLMHKPTNLIYANHVNIMKIRKLIVSSRQCLKKKRLSDQMDSVSHHNPHNISDCASFNFSKHVSKTSLLWQVNLMGVEEIV